MSQPHVLLICWQMQPGIRVVRGPDWDKKRQDGGEGHVGTIVYVPKAGSSDKNVTVIWDSGRERRYRAGHDGKYDLRVYDNGPAGKKGVHVIQSNFNGSNIFGTMEICSRYG